MDQNPYSVGEHLTFGAASLQGRKFEAAVHGMQIIAASLIAGVLIFLGVVVGKNDGEVLGIQSPTFLTILAAGFGFIGIANHFIIPRIRLAAQLKQVVSNGIAKLDATVKSDRILGVYLIQLILGLAMLEGAAFVNLIALMIERHIVSLGVTLLLLGFMVFRFPTRRKVLWWVQDKLRELNM